MYIYLPNYILPVSVWLHHHQICRRTFHGPFRSFVFRVSVSLFWRAPQMDGFWSVWTFSPLVCWNRTRHSEITLFRSNSFLKNTTSGQEKIRHQQHARVYLTHLTSIAQKVPFAHVYSVGEGLKSYWSKLLVHKGVNYFFCGKDAVHSWKFGKNDVCIIVWCSLYTLRNNFNEFTTECGLQVLNKIIQSATTSVISVNERGFARFPVLSIDNYFVLSSALR